MDFSVGLLCGVAFTLVIGYALKANAEYNKKQEEKVDKLMNQLKKKLSKEEYLTYYALLTR